ncbi:TPA: hypothetical protein ACH3X2_008499 [Trebouxia sp. C0005]
MDLRELLALSMASGSSESVDKGAQAVPQVLHDYHTGVPGGQATRRCAAWPEPRWGSLTDGNALEARVGARQQGDFPAQNRSSGIRDSIMPHQALALSLRPSCCRKANQNPPNTQLFRQAPS